MILVNDVMTDVRTTTTVEKEEFCLFSWGANSYGQLGTGDKKDAITMSKCLLDSETVRDVVQVAGGGGHTVLLTSQGRLLVCGWNKNGQLGVQPCDDITTPLPVLPDLPTISKVSCGWNHTLALSAEGHVVTWGCNSFHQLGLEGVEGKTSACSPCELELSEFGGERVVDVAAGLRHSLAVTKTGRIYSWGDGRKGQLGHGKARPQPQPICVALEGYRCTAVAAGMYHSMALTDKREVLVWGLNNHGQCAVDPSLPEPEATHIQPNTHTLTSTSTTDISHTTSSSSPDSVGVSSSRSSTSDQRAGSKVRCQRIVWLPGKVECLPQIAEVHCGWSHSLVVSVDRHVFTWGRSDYGQLGRDDIVRASCDPAGSHVTWSHTPSEVYELRGVREVACGSEHNIAISADGSIITFGWNEHGMCGTGNNENVPRPLVICEVGKRYVGQGREDQREEREGERAVKIGAGAGHSLAVVKTKFISSTPLCYST